MIMWESLIWHLDNFKHSNKLFLLPLSVILSFLLALFFIYIITPILRKYNIIDNPDIRRAHKNPTIRGGGIAIVLSFIFSYSILNYFFSENLLGIYYLIPITILSAVSFADDILELPITPRLFVHFISAFLFIKIFMKNILIFRGEIPEILDIILCTLSIVSFLNIYNFLDGIDGISSLESIHLSLTCIILCIIRDKVIINIDIIFYSSAILLGSSIAFLLFNWHPAKLFLGDVGSTFLGLIHGLNLLLIAASSERLFLASSIAALYYLADGGLTILIRLMRGEKIWLPHLNHFFQQAVKKGMSHKEVTLKIALCNFILMILSISSLYIPHVAIVFSILTVTYTLVHFHHVK